jgi:mannose-6-phosphate isomerase-like protein (cupin superfamily)
MDIIDVFKQEEKQNAHGVSVRELLSTDHAQVMMITLLPGQALKLHATPVDAFFYCLEGDGIVEIGGEQQPLAKDQMVHSPARIPHRLLNEGEKPFRFLVVKTPRQAEASRLL